MLKFMIFSEGKLLNTLVIDDPVVTVGRLAENTIALAGAGVSRRHLRIEEDYDGSYLLNDLHSLNGTVVNGTSVHKSTLHGGDIIVVGSYSIIFEEVPREEPAPDSNACAPVAASPAGEPAFETTLVKPRSPTPGRTVSHESGPEAGNGFSMLLEMSQNRTFKLDKNFMTLGNTPADDIPVSGFMVGRRQAFLRLESEGWQIGTTKMLGLLRVNGRAVKTHLLRNKDHIEIGSIAFRFIETG
jgi:pSer/pThr/pTyr-binding forkhead associated (FHA) protein